MTDNSTFRQIAEESAYEDVQETSQEPSVASEAPTEAPQETFADKGELKGRSPEELEETYNNWQKAYTAKRQKETQELKEYKQKLAEYEARQTAPQQPVEQSVQAAQQQVQLGNMTVEQYTEYIRELNREEAKKVAREEYESIHREEHEQTLASKAVESFSNADERLNEHNPNFDDNFKAEVQRELADLLDQHLSEVGSYEGFDAATLTKQIVERKDQLLDETIKKRTQQSTQAAKMREAKNKKSETRGTTVSSQSVNGNSIRDILSETVDGT